MARRKVEVSLNDADLQTLKDAAAAAKLPLATWARSQLLKAADPATNQDRAQIAALGGK